MLRLITLVVAIGLADSLNPATIAPALYLSTGENPRGRVAQFTASVFAVYLAGGLIFIAGPGQLLVGLLNEPSRQFRHLAEYAAGVMMLIVAGLLWHNRQNLAARKRPTRTPSGTSTALFGAVITAIELPTAFPYFAAITAIVGSGLDVLAQIFLLLLFNLCFVLPLLAILVTLSMAGERAATRLAVVRAALERHWPSLLAGLALLAATYILAAGPIT